MNGNHCIVYKEGELLNFTDEIVDNRTLHIQPFFGSPYTTLLKTNKENFFELCGPLLMLIIELASLIFKGISTDKMEMLMAITERTVDVLLAPVVVAQYYLAHNGLIGFDVTLLHTDCIGYFEGDTIVSRKYPGSVPLFAYLLCFSKQIWALIALSIVGLSLVSSMSEGFYNIIKRFFFAIVNYSLHLAKVPIEELLLKLCPKQIIMIWLLSAFILTNQFTTYLMEFMIRAVPMVRIDTLKELSEHPYMKIYVRFDDTFTSFVKEADTPLKKALSNQLLEYEFIQDVQVELTKGLRSGNVAYISKRNSLIFYLMMFSDMEEKDENEPRLINLLHFSQKTDFYEPYFMLYHSDSPIWMAKNLNKMVNKMQENGVYEQWLRHIIFFNRKRLGPIYKNMGEPLVSFNDLYLQDLLGLFYQLSICLLFSITVYLAEYLWFRFKGPTQPKNQNEGSNRGLGILISQSAQIIMSHFDQGAPTHHNTP